MAYVTPTSRTTGFLVTATVWNQDIVANQQASAPDVFTTKGDILAATAADTGVRLAAGSNGGVLVANTGATAGVQYSDTYAGPVFVNDTANANMTVGLTINQGASDNEALALKSSDVAHGMTEQAETDTYGTLSKAIPAEGGLQISGYSDDTIGVRIFGNVTADITTKSTLASGAITIIGAKKSAATTSSLGADANILTVSGGSTRFILDSDGDSHQDVGTAWTNFDDHNDAELLTSLSVHVSRENDPIKRELGHFITTNRARLEALRLVTFNDDGHHFVNMSRLTMLLVGAVRQVSDRVGRFERALLAMGADPKLLAG